MRNKEDKQNEIGCRVASTPSSISADRRNDKKPRVAIAMSGGVDSSVAAKLLLDQGFEVVGFMMKLWSEGEPNIVKTPSSSPLSRGRDNACCDLKGVEDARRVANQLGISFYLVDAREEFKKTVVDYFIEEYKNLRTPNPCVVCNQRIKFGWLLDFAQKSGCDYLATGHYARVASELSMTNDQLSISEHQNDYDRVASEQISNDKLLISNQYQITNDLNNKNSALNKNFKLENINYCLLRGKDSNKDQSYFLYNLNQEKLSKILFPIGEYTKPEVREMAKKWKLPVHEKKESQEICFIHDGDYRMFLSRQIPEGLFKPGDIVDGEGNVLGRHEGLINYTIGQRKGIEQIGDLPISNSKFLISNQFKNSENQKITKNSKTSDKQPLYVTGFDIENNRLIVGEDREVYRNEMIVKDVNWISKCNEQLAISNKRILVKIRYRHKAVPVKSIIRNSKFVIQFQEPQRAITPGQSAVFYSGSEVLGGGIIER